VRLDHRKHLIFSWIATIGWAVAWQSRLIVSRIRDDGYPDLETSHHFLKQNFLGALGPTLLTIALLSAIVGASSLRLKNDRRIGATFLHLAAVAFFLLIYPVIFPVRFSLIAGVLIGWLVLFGWAPFRATRRLLLLKPVHWLASSLSWLHIIGGWVLIAMVLGYSALLATRTSPVRAIRQSGPSVLFVLIDAVRADAVGRIVDGNSITPNLDRLAKNGIHFTNAYSPSYWTEPSLVGVNTGFLPGSFRDDPARKTSPELPSFVEFAFNSGLSTACIAATPMVWVTNMDRYFETQVQRIDPFRTIDLTPRVLDYYDKHREPSLVYVHFIDTHEPYIPLPEFRPKGLGYWKAVSIWFSMMKQMSSEAPAFPDYVRLYEAEVRQADAAVGKIISMLEKTGRLDDTLLIVTSDHGEAFFEHGQRVHQEPAFYEEQIRVPLILHYPRIALDPEVIEERFSIRDLGRVIALAIDGKLAPGTLAETARSMAGDPILADDGNDNFGFLDGQWKLVRFHGDDFLFDLASDPGETNDLSGSEPDQLARMLEGVEKITAHEAELIRRITKSGGKDADLFLRGQMFGLGYVNK
jgi:Sulfatase